MGCDNLPEVAVGDVGDTGTDVGDTGADVGATGADSITEDAADCCLSAALTPVCFAGEPVKSTGVTGLPSAAAASLPPAEPVTGPASLTTAAAASACGTVLGALTVATAAAGAAGAASEPVIGAASLTTAAAASACGTVLGAPALPTAAAGAEVTIATVTSAAPLAL